MNQVSGVTTPLHHQAKGSLLPCTDLIQAAQARHLEHPGVEYDLALRNLFRSAPLGLYQADLSGRVLGAETGAGSDEEPDQRVGYLHPQDRKNMTAAWKKAMEAGAQWSQHFRYRWADGRVSWLHAVIAPVFGEDGALKGYHGCNIDVTEQVESQAELAISEDRYRVAAEAASLGIWDLDVPANHCFFSPYCFEMLGYRWGQLQTDVKDWTNIVHPESLDGAWRVMDQCINGALENFELEVRLKTNEGKWRWFRCKGKSADRDHTGKALRVIGTLEDINQAKMMEHLLRMEHDLLDLITATSPVGIMFVEPEGNVAFANPRAERILGLCKQEITRRGESSPVGSIVAHDGEAGAGDGVSLAEILKSGCTLANACFAFTRPDGTGALLSISSAPFRDRASKVSGTVVTLEDVTEQKRHDQVLAENDRLLRETQRIAQLGSYVLDLEQDSWSGSAKLYEILGIDEGYPRTLRGHVDLVHEDFREEFIEGFTCAVKESSLFQMEYKITRHSDRVERWVAECCELTGESSGRKVRMVGTIKDITERKTAEEAIRNLNDDLDRRVAERTSQLAAAKREIESFSYSVSHDLRAPLRHINSYSSILVDEYGAALPEEARSYLERICTASSMMGKQIDDLLTLTRVGRAEMKRQSFSISQLAGEVSDMLRDAETEGEPAFIVQQGIMAHGDSALVRLVLQNLLGNAVKYSSGKPSPRVEFGQTSGSGKQTFFVRDNGVGFDMAYVDKLFQPFQRLHGSEFEGTGIGLATVRRIIERHGGSIWAEATENEGATFFFTLS